jgi:hypothetical protein
VQGSAWRPKGRQKDGGEHGDAAAAVAAPTPEAAAAAEEPEVGPAEPAEGIREEDIMADEGEEEMEEEEMEEEEMEEGVVVRQLHPMEKMIKRAEKKQGGANATAARGAVRGRYQRIFFMQDVGPQTGLKYYREWARETAQTIREKLFGGFKLSTAEYQKWLKQAETMPVIWEQRGTGHITDDFFDPEDPAERDKLRWDEFADAAREDEAGWSISEEDAGGAADPNATFTPAYMRESIIDHLGILPPEMVKRSVLDALTPLTAEEARIRMRDKNGTEIFYDPSMDDGTMRMRPGTAAMHNAPRADGGEEPKEGELYVPKVGLHRPILPATAKSVFKGRMGAPELGLAKSELARRKREKKKEGESDSEHVSASESSQEEAAAAQRKKRWRRADPDSPPKEAAEGERRAGGSDSS